MADIFIDFGVTVNKDVNDSIFMDNNGDAIISYLKKQQQEERILSYSYSQYSALVYNSAYNYCLFLFFMSLNTLVDESIIESTNRCKKEYKFNKVQTNLAHIGIDLHAIYDSIVLNYTPVEYGN